VTTTSLWSAAVSLTPKVLRVDAVRYHSIYDESGISVFAARDITIDETACPPSCTGSACCLWSPSV